MGDQGRWYASICQSSFSIEILFLDNHPVAVYDSPTTVTYSVIYELYRLILLMFFKRIPQPLIDYNYNAYMQNCRSFLVLKYLIIPGS